jgi:hypothetical protein
MHTIARFLLGVLVYLILSSTAGAQMISLSTATDANLASEATSTAAGAVIIKRGLLCDGTTCNIIDLGGGSSNSLGLPDRATFSIEKDTGCASTVDFTPQGSNRAGAWDVCTGAGTPYKCCTAANAGCTYDLSGSAAQGVNQQVTVTPISNRYLTGALSDSASCTDVEVMVILYYENDNVR